MNLDEAAALIPLERMGDPRDIGYAALFFVSGEPAASPARLWSSTAG
jgi:hypothetical protein